MGANTHINPKYVGRVDMDSGAAPLAGVQVGIQNYCVRCEIINSGAINNMQVSFNNGADWVTLAPTERIRAVGILMWFPWVRGVVAATTYECVFTYI